MEYVKSVAKAVAAGLTAAIGSLLLIVTGNETLADVAFREWLIVAGNVLASYGVVFAVPNTPKEE